VQCARRACERTWEAIIAGIYLRSATLADENFFLNLFAESHAEASADYLSLEVLYRKSEERYVADFPHADDYVLHLGDGAAVGRLLLVRESNAWRVLSIAVSAAHRGKGIGGDVLRLCQRDCATTGADLHLRVAHGNPARRLYGRLGFQPVVNNNGQADDGHALEMVWRAGLLRMSEYRRKCLREVEDDHILALHPNIHSCRSRVRAMQALKVRIP
jgi:ribosomal protein S18 acetylase RimI-like enzyme